MGALAHGQKQQAFAVGLSAACDQEAVSVNVPLALHIT